MKVRIDLWDDRLNKKIHSVDADTKRWSYNELQDLLSDPGLKWQAGGLYEDDLWHSHDESHFPPNYQCKPTRDYYDHYAFTGSLRNWKITYPENWFWRPNVECKKHIAELFGRLTVEGASIVKTVAQEHLA